MTKTETYYVYECGDLMMSKIDTSGNISWLEVLPKQQREVIQIGSSTGYGPGVSFSVGSSYFEKFNMPFYAGIGTITGSNTLHILFNDNTKNDKVLQLGQKVKQTNNFGKSDCFDIALDMVTGKYTRTSLFNNKVQPTAMPRLGSVVGKDFYIIGKDDRVLAKTKIAVAKISVKK